MNATWSDQRPRWLIAGASGALAFAFLWLLFRAPLVTHLPDVSRNHRASVVLVKPDAAGAALREQTLMHDTTPLFLPTDRGDLFVAMAERKTGNTFLDNDPLKLGVAETGL